MEQDQGTALSFPGRTANATCIDTGLTLVINTLEQSHMSKLAHWHIGARCALRALTMREGSPRAVPRSIRRRPLRGARREAPDFGCIHSNVRIHWSLAACTSRSLTGAGTRVRDWLARGEDLARTAWGRCQMRRGARIDVLLLLRALMSRRTGGCRHP